MSEDQALTARPASASPSGSANPSRLRTFLMVQVIFLLITPLTGGFHFKAWSMLDTALMLGAIGMTALVPVMDSEPQRRLVLRIAIGLYVLAIFDMSANVVISGILGWGD